MPATVRRLLRQSSLHLKLAGEGTSLDDPIAWIYSSDLADPTPFLDDGQMVLTTGTQFPDVASQPDYDTYVDRLVDCGIVALGFGTEVVRAGTPGELIAACAARGLPLVEIPFETPFIAVIRWAADVIAHDARSRDDWSLAAQRAISLAALGHGGLAAVLRALAEQLPARVAFFDSAGELDVALSPNPIDRHDAAVLSAEARRLLSRGVRSSATIEVGGERASLQTVGRRDEPRGVLAVVGARDFDLAAQGVVTSVVALAEVAIEEGAGRRGSIMPLHSELLRLLMEGLEASVRRVHPELPEAPISVLVVDSVDADSVDRRLAGARTAALVAPWQGRVAVLVAADDTAAALRLLGEQHAVGVSEPVDFAAITGGLAQASRALASRGSDAVAHFRDVRERDFAGILLRPELADAARARLASLLSDPDGAVLLHCAAVWLDHNGAWDPAAQQLGIHRHTLKARVDQLGRTLGLSLDRFSDRAQLWAMLAALGID